MKPPYVIFDHTKGQIRVATLEGWARLATIRPESTATGNNVRITFKTRGRS